MSMRWITLLSLFLLSVPAAAQAPAVNPESAAKAKELFAQAVEALGGDAFRNLKTSRLEGRLYGFRQGDLTGMAPAVEYTRYPDQVRQEYGKNKEEVRIISGDKGWTIDINGVKPLTDEEMKAHRETESTSAFHILRQRLGEEGSLVEYAGRDFWDRREVDLVRFVDGENRAVTFWLDRTSHLPVRSVRVFRNPQTRERIEETELFSNYLTRNGVASPRRFVRERNGTRVFEAVIQEVQYNLPFQDSLFVPTAPAR